MNFEIAPKSTEVRLNWDDANNYCESLNIDGKTGWRLPTKDELKVIYQDEMHQSENDFGKQGYWSSTEVNGINAWYLFFNIGCRPSYYRKNSSFYVRAVRDI